MRRQSAPVESLRLQVVEGFPIQITATLEGVLPDSCWSVESVEQVFDPEARSYRLEPTARRADGSCAQALRPFEVQVPIVGAGIAAGKFEVTVGEITREFEIGSLGEFPGFGLPSSKVETAICFPEPGLCFIGPPEWVRDGLAWDSPPFWRARLGVDWWEGGPADIATRLPDGSELLEEGPAVLGWARGTRALLSRQEGEIWSEHIFVPCGEGRFCEFWVEADSEPMLDAAGEVFWRLVRFATRF